MNSVRPESARIRRELARQVRDNPWEDYFADSARSMPAVLIAGSLIVACELAFFFGSGTWLRSGLENWFDWLTAHIHLNQILVLPVLTLGILLAWHVCGCGAWRANPKTMFALAGESVALGLVLAMAIKAIRLVTFPGTIGNGFGWSIASQFEQAIPSLLAVISASVHEEIIFRLGMLGGGVAIARRLGICNRPVQAGMVVLVSLVFAAFHYSTLNPAGEAVDVAGFLCRFGVGMVFGTVYLTRGLALAIGIHCVYNVMSLL